MVPNTRSDKELLLDMSHDSVSAFKAIYDAYWDKMYVSALKKTSSSEIAEEIVQEIFSKLWERRHTLSIENLESYLFTALKYSIISHVRDVIKNRKQEDINNLQDVFSVNPNEKEDQTWDLEAALHNALKFLPDKTRLIFQMSRFDELPNKVIASELDISEKAIEYHITQALKLLRVQLKDFLPVLILLDFIVS
jgi:RNA polymerase sigma-70 factor (ECF subfamily)